jgi:hypothetical protein
MGEKRSEPRNMCADMVGLYWRDKSSWKRWSAAMLEDISRSGPSLQTDAPIPLGTLLRITFPKGRLEGTVRYCFFRDMGYCVGVQFAEHNKWSKSQFRPRHLLDLVKMAQGQKEARSIPGEPPRTLSDLNGVG